MRGVLLLWIIGTVIFLSTNTFSKDISPATLTDESLQDLLTTYLLDDAEITDYTKLIHYLQMKDPTSPASIIGAVRIESHHPMLNLTLKIPLIQRIKPHTGLIVVIPNKTGSSWAYAGIEAMIESDESTAIITIKTPGLYAIYNQDRSQYLAKLAQQKRSLLYTANAESNDQSWELILENDPSPKKIPLILVHGDNSYKVKKDRWDHFLNWVSNHPNFDSTYEIWRFHHDTSKLIGYDGKSGNAKELGDAIKEQFGDNRRILILAHSRGGLVSRAYMCNYGNGSEGDRVLGLITLGTPHHGSPGAVPDWGLETVKSHFMDTILSNILYGFSESDVVNVSDHGTMGLAWDNFDAPENGVPYHSFSLKSKIGIDHVLSVKDTNMPISMADDDPIDPTIYIPDRSFGTLAELNNDHRYFNKIIAYAGYAEKLGAEAYNPLDWMNISFTDHTGLKLATHVMANIRSKTSSESESEYLFLANDGMVPLQSALLLKKDPKNEPIYEESKNRYFFIQTVKVNLNNFTNRLVFRKSIVCPDYDHLDLVEGKGGLLSDRQEYWDHVASNIYELSQSPAQNHSQPQFELYSPSRPSVETFTSGSNCFIRSAFSE